jgi:hypothetical protein
MLMDQERQIVMEEMDARMLLIFPGTGALVYTWIGRHGLRADPTQDPSTWVRNIVRYCERYGWIEDPALILSLLGKLAAHSVTPHGPQIQAAYNRIKSLKPPIFFRHDRAWDTCLLSMELPFLNREVTRRAFEEFDNHLGMEPQVARALVVNGPRGSGKTVTSDFLRLLIGLRPNKDYAMAEFDFAAWSGGSLTPDILALELAKQMGIAVDVAQSSLPRLRSQRPERWTKELAIWLVGEANRSGKIWHLMLDNFYLPGVPDTTYRFIEQILTGLAGQEIGWDVRDTRWGPPLRLVLLGYTRPLPIQNHFIRLQTIKPLTLEDLKTHFRRFYVYKGWEVDEIEIAQIVARYEPLLPSLFPPEPARWKMRELAEVVLRDCAALEHQKEHQGAGPTDGNA